MQYEHLRDLREEHELTQAQLAKILHVAQNTYSQWETGKRPITDEVLIQLADFYHTSVDYLLDRTYNREPYQVHRNSK